MMRDVTLRKLAPKMWRRFAGRDVRDVAFARNVLILSVTLLCAGAAARPPSDPALVLERDKGLRRHAEGQVWILAAEVRTRELLAGLEDARHGVTDLQAELDQLAERNQKQWEAATARSDVLKATARALPGNDPKRRSLEKTIRELGLQGVAPKLLPAQPDVRNRLIELTNRRTALALAILEIRRLMPHLERDYGRLAADADVTAALRQLGTGHRLGPLPQNVRSEQKRLSECERAVFTDASPVYLQSGQPRIGGIVQERVPVTFTWKEGSAPTVLPATLLEALGRSLAPDAPQETLRLDRGRQVNARKIVLPSVRFGGHVLTDVPAWVLPPEAEDLGAQIGPQAFSAYGVRYEPERLRLVIRSK